MHIAILEPDVNNRIRIYQSIIMISPSAHIMMFSKVEDLKIYVSMQDVEVAFLNIEAYGGQGYFLGEELHRDYSRMNLIFISEHSWNLYESMKLRPSGYIPRIPTRDDIEIELHDLRFKEKSL